MKKMRVKFAAFLLSVLAAYSAADSYPASQSITIVDTGSSSTTGANSQPIITGTPTVGSVASFGTVSISSVKWQVTGTWTGTLRSECSIDAGVTWYVMPFHQDGITTYPSTATANFEGSIQAAGTTYCRLRATATMTGTAVVTVVETSNASSTYLNGGISITPSGTQDVNLIKVAGASVATGHGTASGAIRVELPTDGTGVVTNPSIGTNAATAPTSGTQIGGTDNSGNFQSNTIKPLSVQVVGTDEGIVTNSVIHGLTTAGGGGYVDVKVNPSGALTVDASGSTGMTLVANQSVNVAQFGGSNTVTGTGASGSGIPRVTVSNDSAVKVWDGTNVAAVKAASTSPAATDTAMVVTISPNSNTYGWTCGVNNQANSLIQCQAAPGANLSLYITDVIAQSNTGTVSRFALTSGTGTNCGTTNTALIFGSTSALIVAPTNTTAPTTMRFMTPIRVGTNTELCILGSVTNTANVTVNGFTAP